MSMEVSLLLPIVNVIVAGLCLFLMQRGINKSDKREEERDKEIDERFKKIEDKQEKYDGCLSTIKTDVAVSASLSKYTKETMEKLYEIFNRRRND